MIKEIPSNEGLQEPIQELEPTEAARRFTTKSREILSADSDEVRALREEKKKSVKDFALDVLENQGWRVPVEVESPYGRMHSTDARVTEMVPFQGSDGVWIGYILYDEPYAYISGKNGNLEEKTGVKNVHLGMFDLETHEPIGRKSAALLGNDFVNDASGSKAGLNDLDGMRDVIEYMSSYLSQPAERPMTPSQEVTL